MDIGAADTGVVYGDEDVVLGLEGWFGDFGEGDIVDLVEEKGVVLLLSVDFERQWGS